jgi:hypothetical protein
MRYGTHDKNGTLIQFVIDPRMDKVHDTTNLVRIDIGSPLSCTSVYVLLKTLNEIIEKVNEQAV